MADIDVHSDKREFYCIHCNGKILIPRQLPPTTGPCPHCNGTITSPGPEDAAPIQAPIVAPVSTPSVATVPAPAPTPAQVVAPAPVESTPPYVAPPQTANELEGTAATVVSVPPKKNWLVPVTIVLMALILGAAAVAYFINAAKKRNNPTASEAPIDPAVKEAHYRRIGWQKDAYKLLSDFMAATTVEGKMPYVLNAGALGQRMEDFYGGGVINDSDTPADAFSKFELPERDSDRGLFLMIFEQPPQFDMKEFFRPLAPLEVEYGLDEADMLLTSRARIENFSMEPLRALAFFKRTPEGLKLDWETFVQTKYRTLENFVELPEPGQKGIFRVIIVEDVPDKGKSDPGSRTYRVMDPVNMSDACRVKVKVDSEVGSTLSVINWRGTKDNRPVTNTATLELAWGGDQTSPVLEISRILCWEFLGLGGQDSLPNTPPK